MTKEIVSISLGSSHRDYEFKTEIFGEQVRVRRFGADGQLGRAQQLISRFDGHMDAIGLGGMMIRYDVGRRSYTHRQARSVAQCAGITPVVDGSSVKATLGRWTIAQVARERPEIFRHRRILILSGIRDHALAQVLGGYTDRLFFGDPFVHLNLPFALGSLSQLERYASFVLPALCRAPDGRLDPVDGEAGVCAPRGIRYFNQADVIVGDSALIRCFAPAALQGKVVITNDLSAGDVEDLRQRGVESLVTMMPPLDDGHPFVGLDVIEAIYTSFIDKPPDEISNDDYLALVQPSGLEPRVTVLNEPPDLARFAFVIHPLTVDHVFNHPVLKILRFAPRRLVEWLMAYMRPMYLSRITGVRSLATGKEIEGYLFTLGATPRELMSRKPGFTYRRLIVASRQAQQKGASIMGLGAFTKVVGDAGITVAYKSDIAITSGNSLTVAATLEAAKQAVLKMGGRIDEGRAVVIGATGSIGSVCSRLLAQAIHDVVLIAPRPEKLIPLKRLIESETPGARVTMATDAGPHLADADLVVTTTTAIGQRVIDVSRLKPGCVICDVARPPDVREEDAQRRPDLLVIESGEILLPGEPDFGFNIGLPPGVAYACLAEAALLAMEGRFENFTLGRNIEMDKVKEVYRLFKKHGLQLEGLRSFGRYVTDDEIARKRELADQLRSHPERLAELSASSDNQGGGERAPGAGLRRPRPWLVAAAGTVVVGLAWLGLRWRRGRGAE
jgi:predicted amino acid dehydrogenase